MPENEFEREAKKVRLFARLITRTKPKPVTIKKIINVFMSHMVYAEKLEALDELYAALVRAV